MRTTRSTSGTTGKTRRAPVATTLAALCLALPMSGLMGGTAFANGNANKANASSTAPGQAKKADSSTPAPAPAPQAQPTPYTNQGGVTTGSNTTKYGTASDQKGSTFTGVGGGQPSGNIYSPQPYSTADQNNTGANDTSASNPYRSTRNGSPSLNGNGGGRQTGRPCAGCVGKADNKNPPGQAPGGSDHNAGYECDRNHGIGRGNPAHTGCTAGGTTGGSTTGGSTTGGSTGGACTGHMSNGGKDCGHDTTGGSTTGGNTTGGGSTTGGNTTGGNTTGGNTTGGGSTTGGNTTGGGSTTGGSTTGGGETHLCPGTTTPMPANGDCGSKNDKITLCHATGSSTNPFVVITVSKNGAYHGHRKHGDDIIPPYTYNNHGTLINVPGQNWTAANQALFYNGCTAPGTPTTPPTCSNGTPMPASGVCGGGNGGGLTCPNGSAMPASGNVADCTHTPPVESCPAGTTMFNGTCVPAVACPAGTTMSPGNAGCTPPVTCAEGTTMAPGSASCTPPVVCPEDTTMVGPIVPGTTRPGCVVTGGGNGPALTPPGTVIGSGTTPQPVMGNAGRPATGATGGPARAPGVVSARPTALPFTGSSSGLLAEVAGLLLLVGAGLVVAARRKQDAAV